MKHTISPNRYALTITVDESERKQLREWEDEHAGMANESINSDLAMHDFLEPLTCNSELEWVDAFETGDLTNAPMLGIRDSVDDKLRANGGLPKIIEHWGFEPYQVRSVLEDLRDKGEAVFVSEW